MAGLQPSPTPSGYARGCCQGQSGQCRASLSLHKTLTSQQQAEPGQDGEETGHLSCAALL